MSIDIIDTSRNQNAVYWPPVKNAQGVVLTDRFSNPILDDPQELLVSDGTGVMWLQMSEIFMDGKGQTRTSKAIVFLGTDAEEGGVLFLGMLADIPAGMGGDPLRIPRVAQIHRFDRIPTLDGDQYVRKAYL